ncbi:A24 family peptidase [Desulfitibacter alkalitolerans]|uniref:A24 family peptidase n=1 Tax=Desulfitibacter alkalitolerans TaxID=264641 RepID=UPI000685516B|nr:A24 family peptidase [Desulfitibacter alkalitolerans]
MEAPYITNITNAILIIVLSLCLITDIRQRKIYNLITFPALVIGLVLNSTLYGVEGLVDSLKGIGIVLAVLILPFIMGGIGAGDVKLLMTVGALMGFTFAFEALLATFLTGGVIAVALIIKRGMWREVLGRLTANLYLFIAEPVFRRQVNENNTFQGQEKYAFPYGIAIFVGAILVLLFR